MADCFCNNLFNRSICRVKHRLRRICTRTHSLESLWNHTNDSQRTFLHKTFFKEPFPIIDIERSRKYCRLRHQGAARELRLSRIVPEYSSRQRRNLAQQKTNARRTPRILTKKPRQTAWFLFCNEIRLIST